MKSTKKKKKLNKSLSILLTLIVLGGIFYFCYDKGIIKFNKEKENQPIEPSKPAEIKKLKIINEDSNTRSIAVVINNHSKARINHAGLQDAYIIYEMIVEGGITRYLAVYKDKETAKIGSVRSARHYFLDYALENDAIFVHWGWSPQAQSDIKSLKINNINGLYDGSTFYRDKSLKVPTEHRGFTNMERITKAISGRYKYRYTSETASLLKYSVDEIDFSNNAESKIANKVLIKYSNSLKDTYEYDAENKVYKRFVNDRAHEDAITGKQYTFKNIITYQIRNSKISGDAKGRQEFDNIGKGEGYYITNGYAVPITWEKTSRQSQTVYKYKNGSEIKANDGNTFIQIQPLNQTLEIS